MFDLFCSSSHIYYIFVHIYDLFAFYMLGMTAVYKWLYLIVYPVLILVKYGK